MSDLPTGSPSRAIASFEGSRGDPPPRFAIRGASATIGQGPRNEVVLDDETVSTAHARLDRVSDEWRLTDLGSRNGTWVEGVRLVAGEPAPLVDGAAVAFGGVRLTFRASAPVSIEPDPEPPAPPPLPAAPAEVRSTGFRLPVWVAVLVILAIVALVFLVLGIAGDPGTTEPLTGAAAGILGAARSSAPEPQITGATPASSDDTAAARLPA